METPPHRSVAVKSILVQRNNTPSPVASPPTPTPKARSHQPRIPRHMVDTCSERFHRAFERLWQLEDDIRQTIVAEESCLRGPLNCSRLRCQSASRTGRLDRLPPLRAALEPGDPQPHVSSELCGTTTSVWALRRSSAAMRRKSRPDVSCTPAATMTGHLTAASSPPDSCEAAVVRTGCLSDEQRDDIMAAHTLQQRCIAIEQASLVFRYRSQWSDVLSEHAAELRVLRQMFDEIRNSWRVICIQRNYRMHACRSSYTRFLSLLLLLQKCGRALMVRREFPMFGRRVRASRLIASIVAGFSARRMIAREHAPRVRALRRTIAATSIQTAVRGRWARRAYWMVRRRNRASIQIQQAVRGMLQRRAYERQEREYHETLTQLEWKSDTTELRLLENLFRQQWSVWEYTLRTSMVHLAVKQVTAVARMTVALRRMHAPYAPAAQVAVGLLSPSTVGRAEDRWTPKASSLFTAHLPPACNRPQSSASQRRQAALSAHSPTSRKSRDCLALLLVESSEAAARCDVMWSHLSFLNFSAERWLEIERRRLVP